MVRIPSVLVVMSALAAALVGPALAQPAGGYRAVPVTPIQTAQTVIVGDLLWKCGPTGCSAATTGARPAIVCAQTAKKVGKLDSFTANGAAFDAEALAKCNAKAKA